MSTFFREKNNKIFVECYALEVYLPYDYADKEYRGTEYYTLIGDKVRYFGVGNYRAFQSEKEMQSPNGIKTYTLGVPMMITSQPTEIDVRDVAFVKGGRSRKCIVLTFYKDDILMDEVELIRSVPNMMILMSRIEGGRLDHMTPEEAVEILMDAQNENGVNLRMPPEELEVFIAERYRNPLDDSEKLRFADEDVDPDDAVSLNFRQEAMKTTAYQAITHEDINTALISSINRANAGVVDEITPMEAVVRGIPQDDLIADRDKRWAAEAAANEKINDEHLKMYKDEEG